MLSKRLENFLKKAFINCGCTSISLLKEKLESAVQFVEASISNTDKENVLLVTIDYGDIIYQFQFKIIQKQSWFVIEDITMVEK